MKNLTIRHVPDELHRALTREKNRLGQSLNQTVIDLLGQRLGVGVRRSNGLARSAGSWTEEEFQHFREGTAHLEHVDQELWG